MRGTLNRFAAALLIGVALIPLKAWATPQGSETESADILASGTLNIVLADKNGFVMATDSRMSSEHAFSCEGGLQLYCDNSQKLFRTSSRSAMAIAGFAVGRFQTPLDLAVAPVLLKIFGRDGQTVDEELRRIFHGVHIDEQSCLVPRLDVEATLKDALVGMAAISGPGTDPRNLSVIMTFACFDRNNVPILQQMRVTEAWVLAGPADGTLPELIPNYSFEPSTPLIRASVFRAIPAGIRAVADDILAGPYKSDDASIENYYRRRESGQLNDMSLKDMSALAHAILRETKKKFPAVVGGEDQIGEFPSEGNVAFHLPDNLPTETQVIPRVMRWEALLCTNARTPMCGSTSVSFSLNSAQPTGNVHFLKVLMASEFKNVPIALDDNLFVANSFDGATLKWKGSYFLSYRNTFKNCILEVVSNVPPPSPDLAACRPERKTHIELPANTIGLPVKIIPGQSGFGIISSEP